MASFTTTIPRCIEWLQRNPDGSDTSEVAAGLGLTYFHTSGALCQAADQGLIRWVHAPFGKAHNRRVYFTIEHSPKVWGEASRKVASAKGPGLWKKKSSERFSKPASGGKRSEGPKTTVCPCGKDQRFSVDLPFGSGLFGSLGPGRYLDGADAPR